MKENLKYKKPVRLTKKEIEELQEQFPKIAEAVAPEEKASWIGIAIMIISLIVLVGVLYLFYLVWNYEFIGL